MPPVPGKKLTLTVKSTSGSFTEDFNPNNKAEKVLHEAIKELNLVQNPPHPYVLRRESDQRVLALGEQLGDQGITSGDVILVQTSEAEDG